MQKVTLMICMDAGWLTNANITPPNLSIYLSIIDLFKVPRTKKYLSFLYEPINKCILCKDLGWKKICDIE